MREDADGPPKPNLSPWFALKATMPRTAWVYVLNLVVWVALGLLENLGPPGGFRRFPWHSAFAGCWVSLTVLALVPWYASLTHRPCTPDPSAPPLRRPYAMRWWEFASVLVLAGALLAVVWDMSHLHWRLLIAVGTLMAGASTVGWVLWCRTADRRYAPPPSALDDLQEALTKGGWPNTVRGLSDAGHATITIETSEGPELIWCVNLDPRRTLPAESVHLMRGYLLAYSIRRGWILTEGQVSSALVEYAQRFAICVCRPRAIGVWPEEPAPSPQSPPRPASRWHVDTRAPDAPIFRAATTRRRS